MIRSLDPAPFNRIFNDPEVRPWMGHGYEFQDLGVVVTNPANYCFLTPNRDGGYIVARLDDGLYVAHTLALQSARGRPMLQLMRDGFAYMFTATDAVEIVTTCPDGNDAGARWADTAGFRETHRRETWFPLGNEIVGTSFRSLGYADWVPRHEPNRRLGALFHDQLQIATHADDPIHDAWVGATVAGCQAGNIEKAVRLYNRFALQTGYHPAAILSTIPPLIDTGDAIVGLDNGALDILYVKASEPAAVAVA